MCSGSRNVVLSKTPKGLEKSVKKEYKKYNLKSYITVEGDCYRVTLFDKKEEQTMMFIPLQKNLSNTEIVKQCILYTKEKYPELFRETRETREPSKRQQNEF